MREITKKSITAAAAACVALSMTAGCSDKKETAGSADVKFNKTELPIVNEPVTLEATVCRPATFGKYDEMSFYKELEEKTNVKINWTEIMEPYAEKINLIFASNDYPDLMFRGATDSQILSAADSGDVMELNTLIDEYAPNWKKVIEDSYIRKTITSPDGKIYGLPFVRADEADYGIRDVWLINNDWLQKLNLEIPETLDDLYNVLKAFKAAEGKELPSNIVPWYLRYNQNVGGHFDLYSSFGITDNTNHIMVKDGKVIFTANTEEAKEVAKFLNKLYSEGLIPSEMFTDDFAAYASRLNSDPANVGLITSYNHPFADEHTFVPMLVPRSDKIDKVLMRQQTSMVIRNAAVIFSNNPYPEITMRWLDELAKAENSVQLLYGKEGETIYRKDNGRYGFFEGDDVVSASKTSSGNWGPAAVTSDVIDLVDFSGGEAIRRKYFESVYKDNRMPMEQMYPNVFFTEEQQNLRAQYANDIASYVEKQFADFIVNGNIDAGWDKYCNELKNLGLDTLLGVYQEGLDNFNSN